MDPVLARAFRYPYPRPPDSFLWKRDGIRVIQPADWWPPARGKVPVVAFGSNGSPEQLERKFRGARVAGIPCLRASLRDHDVVYAAFLAPYGSLPATLAPSPGTSVSVFVQILGERALARLDRTEGAGVAYDRVAGFPVTLADGTEIPGDEIRAYVCRAGWLVRDGAPVALAEIPAEGRSYPALGQPAALELARDLLDPRMRIEDFVRETISSAEIREGRCRRLRELWSGGPPRYPRSG